MSINKSVAAVGNKKSVGHKNSNPGGPRAKGLDSKTVQQIIRENVDWIEKIQILDKLATGGYEYKNGLGKKMIAQPNLEAMQILLAYGWPKPAPESELTPQLAALNNLAIVLAALALPQQTGAEDETAE